MKKKYSVLFKKINYDLKEGYFFLKPIKVIENTQVNFNYSVFKSKYTKESSLINENELWISEDKKLYGYDISKSKLKEMFPRMKEEYLNELYLSEINDCIYLGYYNKDTDCINILNLYKDVMDEVIKDFEFSDFFMSFDPQNKSANCELNEGMLNKYINLLENNKTSEVIEFFKNILQDINELEEFSSVFTDLEDEEIDEDDIENKANKSIPQKNKGGGYL